MRALPVTMVICLLLLPGCSKPSAPKVRPERAPAEKGLASTAIKLVTWNIQNGRDEGDGQNGWPQRKHALGSVLEEIEPDILCVQEAFANQVRFLQETLARHDRVGVGRVDGKSEGEHAAIFYRRDRFKRLEGGTFWLSETPEVPSRTWDKDYFRVCTWARFKDVESQKMFRIYNTHFSLIAEAQEKSARLIISRIAEGDAKKSVALCGDFNCGPGGAPWKIFEAVGLINAELAVGGDSLTPTWHRRGVPVFCIDAIFVRGDWRVTAQRVIMDGLDGVFPSDHFGVMATLEFRTRVSVSKPEEPLPRLRNVENPLLLAAPPVLELD